MRILPEAVFGSAETKRIVRGATGCDGLPQGVRDERPGSSRGRQSRRWVSRVYAFGRRPSRTLGLSVARTLVLRLEISRASKQIPRTPRTFLGMTAYQGNKCGSWARRVESSREGTGPHKPRPGISGR